MILACLLIYPLLVIFVHACVYDSVSVHTVCLCVSVYMGEPMAFLWRTQATLRTCPLSHLLSQQEHGDYTHEHLAFYAGSGNSNSAVYVCDKCVTQKAIPPVPPTTSCPVFNV